MRVKIKSIKKKGGGIFSKLKQKATQEVDKLVKEHQHSELIDKLMVDNEYRLSMIERQRLIMISQADCSGELGVDAFGPRIAKTKKCIELRNQIYEYAFIMDVRSNVDNVFFKWAIINEFLKRHPEVDLGEDPRVKQKLTW